MESGRLSARPQERAHTETPGALLQGPGSSSRVGFSVLWSLSSIQTALLLLVP